jgi:hypothetical protein
MINKLNRLMAGVTLASVTALAGATEAILTDSPWTVVTSSGNTAAFVTAQQGEAGDEYTVQLMVYPIQEKMCEEFLTLLSFPLLEKPKWYAKKQLEKTARVQARTDDSLVGYEYKPRLQYEGNEIGIAFVTVHEGLHGAMLQGDNLEMVLTLQGKNGSVIFPLDGFAEASATVVATCKSIIHD